MVLKAMLKSTKTAFSTFEPPSSDFAIVCARRPTAFNVLLALFVCKLEMSPTCTSSAVRTTTQKNESLLVGRECVIRDVNRIERED